MKVGTKVLVGAAGHAKKTEKLLVSWFNLALSRNKAGCRCKCRRGFNKRIYIWNTKSKSKSSIKVNVAEVQTQGSNEVKNQTENQNQRANGKPKTSGVLWQYNQHKYCQIQTE